MKTPFILVLVLLAWGSMAANTGYVKLSTSTVNKSQLIQDLRQLGAEYTLEKEIFKPKSPLPNGYWLITKTESVYRKINNGVTYYKYTVQLYCDSEPYLIRAIYTVAFTNSNGNTVISSYSYSILDKHPDDAAVADNPIFMDNKLLKKGSDFQKYLDQGIEYTVKDAISKGLIKKSTYSFVRLFSIQDTGYSFPYGYSFLVQLVSKQGYNYRARITVWTKYEVGESYEPEYVIYPNV